MLCIADLSLTQDGDREDDNSLDRTRDGDDNEKLYSDYSDEENGGGGDGRDENDEDLRLTSTDEEADDRGGEKCKSIWLRGNLSKRGVFG